MLIFLCFLSESLKKTYECSKNAMDKIVLGEVFDMFKFFVFMR